MGLVESARIGSSDARENLLVLVDQFEEIFRMKSAGNESAGKSKSAEFVRLLLAASAQRSVPIYVVITMRSDFLGDCSQFRDLPEMLNRAQYLSRG
jgi:hypothetical protein